MMNFIKLYDSVAYTSFNCSLDVVILPPSILIRLRHSKEFSKKSNKFSRQITTDNRYRFHRNFIWNEKKLFCSLKTLFQLWIIKLARSTTNLKLKFSQFYFTQKPNSNWKSCHSSWCKLNSNSHHRAQIGAHLILNCQHKHMLSIMFVTPAQLSK